MRVALLSAPEADLQHPAESRRSLHLLQLLGRDHEVRWFAPRTVVRAAGSALLALVRAVTYEPDGALVGGWRRLLPWMNGRRPASLDGGFPRLAEVVEDAEVVVLEGRWSRCPLEAEGPPLLVDLVDSEAHDFRRRAALTRGGARRVWLRRSKAAEARQRRLLQGARGGLAVTPRARALAGSEGGNGAGRPVWVVPRPLRVPPATEPSGGNGFLGRHTPLLVLGGELDGFPTQEGIGWWLERVWPALASRRPGVRLLVHGPADPGPVLRRRVLEAGGRIVRERNLLEVLAASTVAVEPARCGLGGSPLILGAWARRVPVVASSWAAAGTTGRRGRDLRVADDPEAWVSAVAELLEDPTARERLAAEGAERLRRDYSPEGLAKRLGEALAAAAASPERPSAQRSTQ